MDTDTRRSKAFLCNLCGRNFTRKFSLKNHLRLHERKATIKSRDSRIICPEQGCTMQFIRYVQLRDHLVKEHGVEVEYEELEFKSTNDFEIWRSSIQNDTLSEYVKKVQTQILTNGDHKTFLYCNRSDKGRLIQETNRKRKLKSQGSKKTGKSCPSMMEIIAKPHMPDGIDGDVFVKFWKTHRGHNFDIAHLRLSKRCRDEIAEKIISGVPFDTILDDIWDGKIEGPNRMAILNKSDLHNIVRDYNLSYSNKPRENDGGNVQLEEDDVKELGGDSPFLFFKNQGEECIGIFKNDFSAEVTVQSTEVDCIRSSATTVMDCTDATGEVDCTSATSEMDCSSATTKVGCRSAKPEGNNPVLPKRTVAKDSLSKNDRLLDKAKLIVDSLGKECLNASQKNIVEKKLDCLINILNVYNSEAVNQLLPDEEVHINGTVNKQLQLSCIKQKGSSDAINAIAVDRLVPVNRVNINHTVDKQFRLVFIKTESDCDDVNGDIVNRVVPIEKMNIINTLDNELDLVSQNNKIVSDTVNSYPVTRLVPAEKVFIIDQSVNEIIIP